MSQSIPSPAQEAAAAIVRRINEKPTSPTVEEIAALIGKPAGQGGLHLSISATAEEIADLWKLRDTLEQGEWQQNKQAEATVQARSCVDRPHIHFRTHRQLVDARRDSLEAILLGLEPENLEEALSLLLIFADSLDDFVNAYVDDAGDGDDPAGRDLDSLNEALHAIARQLIQRGARSPLVGTYFPVGCDVPRADDLAAAVALARQLTEEALQEEAAP
jgi:hypothetical protein